MCTFSIYLTIDNISFVSTPLVRVACLFFFFFGGGGGGGGEGGEKEGNKKNFLRIQNKQIFF